MDGRVSERWAGRGECTAVRRRRSALEGERRSRVPQRDLPRPFMQLQWVLLTTYQMLLGDFDLDIFARPNGDIYAQARFVKSEQRARSLGEREREREPLTRKASRPSRDRALRAR